MILMMQGIKAMRALQANEAKRVKVKASSHHNKGLKLNTGLSKKIMDLVSVKAYTINDLAYELKVGRDNIASLVTNLSNRLNIDTEKVGNIKMRIVRGIGLESSYISTGITCRDLNYRALKDA